MSIVSPIVRAAPVGLHDMVAHRYDPDQSILRTSQDEAYAQIEDFVRKRPGKVRVLELGVGTGALLERLSRLPQEFDFTGVDVSRGMLDRARQATRMRTLQASAEEAGGLLKGETFDLIIAHFLLAYLPLDRLMSSCLPLLASGGAMSLVTSTNQSRTDSASEFGDQLRRLSDSRHPLKRFMAGAIKRGLRRTTTPDDFQEIEGWTHAHGFEVQDRWHRKFPVHLRDPNEAHAFCVDGGWFVNAVPLQNLPPAMVRWLSLQLMKLGCYPIRWPQYIESVMLRRRDSREC